MHALPADILCLQTPPPSASLMPNSMHRRTSAQVCFGRPFFIGHSSHDRGRSLLRWRQLTMRHIFLKLYSVVLL